MAITIEIAATMYRIIKAKMGRPDIVALGDMCEVVGDKLSNLAYADFLEEIGEDCLATAHRYVAKHSKRPYKCPKSYKWIKRLYGFAPRRIEYDGQYMLDSLLFSYLQGGKYTYSMTNGYAYKYYTNYAEAMIRLGHALSRIHAL